MLPPSRFRFNDKSCSDASNLYSPVAPLGPLAFWQRFAAQGVNGIASARLLTGPIPWR